MAGSLLSAWQKWGRARSHQETLAGQIPGDTYLTRAERHRDGLEYVFRVGEIPPFDPAPFALLAGDCLFNLRAALDHIVYQLHVRHYRGKVPRDAARDSAFPIFSKPRTDRNGKLIPVRAWNEIRRLSIRDRRAITRLQPYNRRNDQYRWVRQALDDLSRLNNIDKHRHLHVVRHAVVAVPVSHMPPEWGHRALPSWVPLKSHAEVMRWTFEVAPPEAEIARYIKTQSYAIGDVTLDEEAGRTPLAPLLQSLVNNVETVIQRFRVFLPN